MPKQAAIIEAVLQSQRPLYGFGATVKPLLVKGSFLYLSDIELPYQDSGFLNNCITLARNYGVQQCVIGGDLFLADAFSPFKDGNGNADAELAEVDEYLPGLLQPFARYYYFVGNHDQRVARALAVNISNENALRLMIGRKTWELYQRKVLASEYRWMLAAHNWRLTHGKNYSQIPANVAKKYAEKYQCNVIHAHTHHQGQMHDVSGRYLAIESGCCVDVRRLEYSNTVDTASTAMVNGAVLMLDSGDKYTPMLLSKTFSDWDFELWRAKKRH